MVIIRQFCLISHDVKINETQCAPRGPTAKAKMVCPEAFLCPIGLGRMLDPVVCADGHSYERACIEEWFQLGRTTSPLTNDELFHRNLTPNHTLRSAIKDWWQQHLLQAQAVFAKRWRERERALSDHGCPKSACLGCTPLRMSRRCCMESIFYGTEELPLCSYCRREMRELAEGKLEKPELFALDPQKVESVCLKAGWDTYCRESMLGSVVERMRMRDGVFAHLKKVLRPKMPPSSVTQILVGLGTEGFLNCKQAEQILVHLQSRDEIPWPTQAAAPLLSSSTLDAYQIILGSRVLNTWSLDERYWLPKLEHYWGRDLNMLSLGLLTVDPDEDCDKKLALKLLDALYPENSLTEIQRASNILQIVNAKKEEILLYWELFAETGVQGHEGSESGSRSSSCKFERQLLSPPPQLPMDNLTNDPDVQDSGMLDIAPPSQPARRSILRKSPREINPHPSQVRTARVHWPSLLDVEVRTELAVDSTTLMYSRCRKRVATTGGRSQADAADDRYWLDINTERIAASDRRGDTGIGKRGSAARRKAVIAKAFAAGRLPLELGAGAYTEEQGHGEPEAGADIADVSRPEDASASGAAAERAEVEVGGLSSSPGKRKWSRAD